MGSYNEAIIRHASGAVVAATVAALTQRYPGVREDRPKSERGEFVKLQLTEEMFFDASGVEMFLASLSKEFDAEIIFLLAQSTTDTFQLVHWQRGTLVRAIGCSIREEGVWDRVEGTPEEWEAVAFKGEEVTDDEGNVRRLGRRKRGGPISAPKMGDSSLLNAAKYAECASRFYATDVSGLES